MAHIPYLKATQKFFAPSVSPLTPSPSLSLSLSLSLLSPLLVLSPVSLLPQQTPLSTPVAHYSIPRHAAHITASPLKRIHVVSRDAVLASHRRARSRPGAVGRRTGREEHGPDGCARRVHGERASPPEHPCPRGAPRCPLRGIPTVHHRTSLSPFSFYPRIERTPVDAERGLFGTDAHVVRGVCGTSAAV